MSLEESAIVMTDELKTAKLTELVPGVCFDQNEASLEGIYLDELSTYRAKKVWTETLETNFLLEPNYDFLFKVVSDIKDNKFVLKCNFTSACGRYAFWRLTRNQAPEAQYSIETAHIPGSEKTGAVGQSINDLSEMSFSPLVITGHNQQNRRNTTSSWKIFKKIKKLFK